jgi:spore germination protein GerM
VIDTDLGRKIVAVLLIVAAVIVGTVLVRRWIERHGEERPGLQVVPEETRSVTLYFASRQADGLVTETREIPVETGLESEVRAVMTALAAGPQGDDGVSAIPPGTLLLQAYWVEETLTLYLDFNRTISSAHPGGSAAEYYTIAQIVRTIQANFPQVRHLQILIDGYPVETIAGHYAVDKPIDVMKWR